MKTPIDLEWVFDGKEIQWVQMRKITTLNAHNVFQTVYQRYDAGDDPSINLVDQRTINQFCLAEDLRRTSWKTAYQA